MRNKPIVPIIICAKDAAKITGRGLETSRRCLRAIRKKLGKEPHQVITMREFCEHMGIDAADIKEHFRGE